MNVEEYEIMANVEDRHWWYAGLRALLERSWRRHVRGGASQPLRALDVGCGTGAVLEWLAQRAEPFGIDLSMEAARFCRARRHGQDRFALGSAVSLPFGSASFDIALCLDVLGQNSIADKRAPVREIYRILKPGGILIANLPAYQWLMSSHDAAVYNDHRFTRREVLGLLRECSFEPVETTYWNTLLFPPIMLTRFWRKFAPARQSDLAGGCDGVLPWIFSKALTLERRLIALTPMPFGLSILTVARKR